MEYDMGEKKGNSKKSRALLTAAGAILLLLGIFVIAETGNALFHIFGLIGAGLIIAGAAGILSFVFKPKDGSEQPWQLGLAILEAIAGAVILLGRLEADSIAPLIFGIVTLYAAVTGFTNAGWLRKNGEKWKTTFCYAAVRFAVSVIIIFNPFTWGTVIIDTIMGLYLIFYGALWLYMGIFTMKRTSPTERDEDEDEDDDDDK